MSAPSLGHQLLLGEVTNHGLWQSGFLYRDVGPDFAPADGYTGIQDIRGPTVFAVYSGVAAQQSEIKSYRLAIVGDRLLDRSGAAHQADTYESASVELKNLLNFRLVTAASELRTYEQAYPSYTNGTNVAFDNTTVGLNYRDGTPSPTDAYYTFGPFAVNCIGLPATPQPCLTATNGYAPAFTQQFDFATTRAFRGGYSATAEYGGTLERPFAGISDAQFLRRLSVAHALGSDSQIALSLREISGEGGFAAPGNDLAISYHKRFRNQSQLYLEYGSPASYGTVQRFVLKYVYHLGEGGAGT